MILSITAPEVVPVLLYIFYRDQMTRIQFSFGGVSLLLLLLLTSGCVLPQPPFDEKKWKETVDSERIDDLYAPHFKDGRYFNPWLDEERGSFLSFLRWRFSQKTPYSEREQQYLPKVQGRLLERIALLPSKENFMVWLGHASFLIRIDGKYILTDPMLSERALLPKRRTPPALTKHELQTLQSPLLVLISHNHYDHLDADTLSMLPEGTTIIVPPGLGTYVSSLFEGKVAELDWWKKWSASGMEIISLPTQHWSRRIGQSVNQSLWNSFLITAGGFSIYFGGDSGYFVGYREFGRRYKGIDYALLPITAYHPRWFMHYPHMNVEESLRAFDDLGAHFFVPTQWGTFHLGDNPPGLPMLELKKALKQSSRNPQHFLRPQVGEILIITKNDGA